MASGGTDNAAILSAVFGLNNEIGKMLRPTGDPSLRSLQLKVNDVAVAAKTLDRANLRAAMEKVRDEFLRTPHRG